MSRAFVKDDADADPVLVPDRAPLSDGVTNRVTPGGYAALEREGVALEEALAAARAAGDPRAVAAGTELLDALRARVASALVVSLPEPLDRAVFGADVTLRREDGRTLRFRIVGVDEADPGAGKIAFTAPLAAAVEDARVGEVRVARVGDADVRVEVVAVCA